MSTQALSLSDALPKAGQLVRVRSRRWLVEQVTAAPQPGESPVVTLACAEDDAQGEMLTVYWSYELDREILEEENWKGIGAKGFDQRDEFAAFLHTMRWGCVTATDPSLLQSPFRAGIQIDPYQMEPLRKALQLPRVNLFIADDTGLGKTIEAGLIAQELLLRKKINHIVVAAPPSVLDQWKAELEERFGLLFEILDRDYLAQVRRERGFGVNPWKTHSRFLISHKLLIDESYASSMREWLDELRAGDDDGSRPGSLLILDEAHHAAPSSGNRYGIETKFTRAIRDLAWRFEHRLFLSATPHNGHSSSFSTLLEILDPTRFTRGVKIKGKGELEKVMVRRIKEDIRRVQGGFPVRKVQSIRLDGLPEETPELVLSRLLQEYRKLREKRHAGATEKAKAAAGLLVVGLQQRLLSSIEAFARTLKTHIGTVERQWKRDHDGTLPAVDASNAFTSTEDPADADLVEQDDVVDDATQAADEESSETADQRALAASADDPAARNEALFAQERELLKKMQTVAEAHRYTPDTKMRALLAWIREHLCPSLPEDYADAAQPGAAWNDRRVLIFTENRQGTKVRLREILSAYIKGTPEAERRIAVLDGTTPKAQRKVIQKRFNAPPSEEPLRILIATDAAREGLNLQAHCADLFHFDLPWNPGRLEQRNGRIDRKLQPADEVRCHYFVLPQRVEDRVLEVLVQKTEVIQRELGSLSQVIHEEMERLLKRGITDENVGELEVKVAEQEAEAARAAAAQEELEAARERETDLRDQIERCERLLEKSRKWVRFEASSFREALSCSLRLQGLQPLQPADPAGRSWNFPSAQDAEKKDPSWKSTLDSLRAPRGLKQKLTDWRREAPVRPVVFEDSGTLTEDTVHLHLQQRVAQRLLSRFRSQGFLHQDLSRACLAQTQDGIPRVILLGRLALYGAHAERLHEEIIPVAARWVEPAKRDGSLEIYARDAQAKSLALLEDAMQAGAASTELPAEVRDRLHAAMVEDIEALRPKLEPRAEDVAAEARERLAARGEREATEFLETLGRQRKKVEIELAKYEKDRAQIQLAFNADERRQVEEHARSWQERLQRFAEDARDEPERIRARYRVRATRIEPIGLVYLWPQAN